MSLGKTFTNSIVREIGRNYGKAISNSLMGDSHSTPIRAVSDEVYRMRGRVYRNNFDEAIKKFSIKGATAVFNQGLNIHSEFFTLVEEAKADNTINIFELEYLVEEINRAVITLTKVKSALEDYEDKRSVKIEEKIKEIDDFTKEIDKSLIIENLPKLYSTWKLRIGFFLSLIGLDTFLFGKLHAKIISSFLLLMATGVSFSSNNLNLIIAGYLFCYNIANMYLIFDGFWMARKITKTQRLWNQKAMVVKENLKTLL